MCVIGLGIRTEWTTLSKFELICPTHIVGLHRVQMQASTTSSDYSKQQSSIMLRRNTCVYYIKRYRTTFSRRLHTFCAAGYWLVKPANNAHTRGDISCMVDMEHQRHGSLTTTSKMNRLSTPPPCVLCLEEPRQGNLGGVWQPLL